MNTPTPPFIIDASDETVTVPTQNGPSLRLDRSDFDRLPEHARHPFWNRVEGRMYAYVNRAPTIDGAQEHPHAIRISRSRKPQATPLARFVLNAGRGERVGYLSRDTADLRRQNLYVI